MRARRAMALAVTIGVVSLVAILAVATLSLSTRMVQGSSLGIRDARLNGAVGFGLVAAIDQWRARSIGRLAIGATVGFPVTVPGISVGVAVTVTRVDAEVFWIVSEAVAEGEATRRENLVVRVRMPNVADLLDADSTDVGALGALSIDSVAAEADVDLDGGAILSGPIEGVVVIRGDATISGGSGQGILIVEGRLAIVGPLNFTGVIFAHNGISVAAPNVTVYGMIRAAGDQPLAGDFQLIPSEAAVQDVLSQSLRPSPVAGRRWAEIH